jgi:hypothetical protein
MVQSLDILSCVAQVTKKWTKQRKAEERGSSSSLFRGQIFEPARAQNALQAAEEILPDAYQHASGGGLYSVSKRQLYYASREEFKRATGRELDADSFSNRILVQYLNRHPEQTAGWKITADARGMLVIPNAHHEERIPCGTLEIEEHLRVQRQAVDPLEFGELPIAWPSLREHQRYQAVVFVEKEGFAPLIEQAKIAERFDVAFLSCKGQSVVAARQYVDEVCRRDGGVPLLVVHDLDKAGFEISQRLTTVSQAAENTDRVAYRFRNQINVVDLGLGLTDVEAYDLEFETVKFSGGFAPDSIATPAEQAFLRSNRRVELNAFTSPQFIEWLERKLREQGLGQRLIPDDEVLVAAFRRALAVGHMNEAIARATAEAEQLAEEGAIPKNLRRLIQKEMKKSPDDAWDKVVYNLAQAKAGRP